MPYWARKDWDRLLGLNFVVSTPLPQTRSSFRPGVSYFKQQALLCDRRALVGEGGVAHFGGQNADMRAVPVILQLFTNKARRNKCEGDLRVKIRQVSY